MPMMKNTFMSCFKLLSSKAATFQVGSIGSTPLPSQTQQKGGCGFPTMTGLFGEMGLSSSSSQRRTSPIKLSKGSISTVNSKEWLLKTRTTVDWAACPSSTDGLSEPNLPRSESLVPSWSATRLLEVVSPSFSHSGTKKPDKRTSCDFGARKPPGTCPVIYFWLFLFLSKVSQNIYK